MKGTAGLLGLEDARRDGRHCKGQVIKAPHEEKRRMTVTVIETLPFFLSLFSRRIF